MRGLSLSAKGYTQLSMGLIPGAMEDKWFLYLEDNKLYCHQSWTGYCAYIVEFVPCEEGYRAEAVLTPMEQTRDGLAAATVKVLVAFLAEDYARQTRYTLLMEQLVTPLGTMDTTGLPLYTPSDYRFWRERTNIRSRKRNSHPRNKVISWPRQ